MEWIMEWNSEHTQLSLTHVTGAAQSRLKYLVHLQGCYLTAEALRTALPTIMLLYQSMVPLLAHHQMLCYCCIAKSGSRTKNKGQASQDYSYSLRGQKCDGRNECLILCLFASVFVSAPQYWSLLGLTTSVAAFLLNNSKHAPHAQYCSQSTDHDIMIPDKEECWQHALDSLIQPLW